MIKGTFQTSKTNNGGFTSVKVAGTWYGADKKNWTPNANDGDTVQFEAFDKESNGKTWPTYKTASFKKLVTSSGTGSVTSKGSNVSAGRDTYWADKAATDAVKEPRIAYQASLDRAISTVDLALRHGAVSGYVKAKDTAKLEIVDALIEQYTHRYMQAAKDASFEAKVPVADTVDEVVETDTAEETTSEVWE